MWLILFSPEAMKTTDASSTEIKLHETWLVGLQHSIKSTYTRSRLIRETLHNCPQHPSLFLMSCLLKEQKVDPTKPLLSIATRNDFGLIDVNVPQKITNPNPPYNVVDYSSASDDSGRKNGERLGRYIWENYIEPYEFAEGIVLCGIGESFNVVQRLIREMDAARFIPEAPFIPDAPAPSSKALPSSSSTHHHHHNGTAGAGGSREFRLGTPHGGIRAVLGFIANNPVRPVELQLSTSTISSDNSTITPGTYMTSNTNQNLHWGFSIGDGRPLSETTWYRETSRIYISPSHQFWERFDGAGEGGQMSSKLRKMMQRFGGVQKAASTTLGGMVEESLRDCWEFVAGKMVIDIQLPEDIKDEDGDEDGEEDSDEQDDQVDEAVYDVRLRYEDMAEEVESSREDSFDREERMHIELHERPPR